MLFASGGGRYPDSDILHWRPYLGGFWKMAVYGKRRGFPAPKITKLHWKKVRDARRLDWVSCLRKCFGPYVHEVIDYWDIYSLSSHLYSTWAWLTRHFDEGACSSLISLQHKQRGVYIDYKARQKSTSGEKNNLNATRVFAIFQYHLFSRKFVKTPHTHDDK